MRASGAAEGLRTKPWRLRPKFPLALYSRRRPRSGGAIRDYDLVIAVSRDFRRLLNRGSTQVGERDAAGAYADFDLLIQRKEVLPGAYTGRGRTLSKLMNDPIAPCRTSTKPSAPPEG